MAQPKRAKLARQRDYCLSALAKSDNGEQRRKILEAKLLHIEETLRGARACRECGRTLTDPTSIERGIGSDCAAKLVRAVAS